MTTDRSARDVVIVDAVRSPIGRRNGGLAHVHPADLLAEVLSGLLERTGIDPAGVDQIVGGCVDQVGMQTIPVQPNVGHPQGLRASTGEFHERISAAG